MNSPHQRVICPELHQQTALRSLLLLWFVPQLCWHQGEDKRLHLGAELTALTLLENNNIAIRSLGIHKPAKQCTDVKWTDLNSIAAINYQFGI